MADVRPFRALRYRPEAVPDLGDVLAPPFDVIGPEERGVLEQRSPYNIVRIELPGPIAGADSAPYEHAAALLGEWRSAGVLARDEEPGFYLYRQEFAHEGRRVERNALFARVRLEPWEAGAVRPHERTLAVPKRDRLELLRHVRANVSPVFALYRDPPGEVCRLVNASESLPTVEAATPDGQHHALAALTDGALEAIAGLLRDRALYVADGHHRYETALAYREERRAVADDWTGEEPENFVLMALVAAEDPGLVVLPIHRLVRPPSLPPDVIGRLERSFQVDDVTPKSYDGTALLRLLARLEAARAAGATAFGALGLEEGRLHLLTLRDRKAVEALMPRERSPAWKALDASVLDTAVVRGALEVDRERGVGEVYYAEDAAQAHREVETGRWPLAFLMNATPVEQILAVADAGERMPEKSTYFYPKLPTGLVLYAFE